MLRCLSAILDDETNEEDDEMKLACALSMDSVETMEGCEGGLEDSGTIKEDPKKEKHNYPPFLEEPKRDQSLLCRVGLRLPDGRRVQRNFLRFDPIQLVNTCRKLVCQTNGLEIMPKLAVESTLHRPGILYATLGNSNTALTSITL
ncbi:hypothetical protein L1987_48360 [Smallanthus sonchifolius]|uniref:Uncharacterized protein n=1 Tax=Smallanthus sonchifolius TaxID=185202 RepID=A0ACB9FRQ5_9ASTR|nr:hypothetical protein L1987_48360 [Smallanthus sonchifolius]